MLEKYRLDFNIFKIYDAAVVEVIISNSFKCGLFIDKLHRSSFF